ncbi:hypothetical protein F4782DRAFT_483684 [Xylaria castorea]|nr:hypothetical protein F4782DRAFT_483684 [Xylaria castorea]
MGEADMLRRAAWRLLILCKLSCFSHSPVAFWGGGFFEGSMVGRPRASGYEGKGPGTMWWSGWFSQGLHPHAGSFFPTSIIESYCEGLSLSHRGVVMIRAGLAIKVVLFILINRLPLQFCKYHDEDGRTTRTAVIYGLSI